MATTRTQTTQSTTLQKASPSASLIITSKLPKGSVLVFHYQPQRSIALG